MDDYKKIQREFMNVTYDVVIVGAGFSGLTAAYELSKNGKKVIVIEASDEVGGLASAFDVGGERLDRFYHHWFTNDLEVMELIDELGLMDKVQINPTNTGIYYANNFFKLSTPWDLLRFSPLGFIDRIRLGLLTLRARRVRKWQILEKKSAKEWLCQLGGENVYKIVWEPLLKGKFGPYAEQVSAVWFWNKLKLRGGSRGSRGEERLAYLSGGFVVLAESLASKINKLGSKILLKTPVHSIHREDENLWSARAGDMVIKSKKILVTTALPIIANLVKDWASNEQVNILKRIKYLGNVCLVLELDRSLSSTYWLNVNDPSFPFVGVIEHTNFEHPRNYGGKHIVYLSKYLPVTDPLYSMSADVFFEYTYTYLKKMFPDLDKSWVKKYHLWKAEWSQPVVERDYGSLIPSQELMGSGFFICSMAQIYPEDRGTNYAIREGRKTAKKMMDT